MDTTQLQSQVNNLQAQVDQLSGQVNLNNFSSSQDFQKYSRFNTRFKVPHYAATPSTCDVGEIVEVGGKFYGCSATDTWVVLGTQS